MTPEKEQELVRILEDMRKAAAEAYPLYRDVFLARVAPDIVVKVSATGPLGWREFDRLVEILKVQRDVLTEGEPST